MSALSVAQEAYGKILGCTYPDIIIGRADLPEAGLECAPTVQIVGEYVRGLPIEENPERDPAVLAEMDVADDMAGEDRLVDNVAEVVPRGVRRALSKGVELAGRFISKIQSGSASAAKLDMQFAKEPLGIVSWHKHRLRLAVLGNYDRVLLYDLEAKGPSANSAAVLVHEFQRDVAVMEWRPHSGATLAVGCRNGICIWSLNPPISVGPPTPSTPIRGGIRAPVAANIPKNRLANANMVFHKSPGFEHVTCVGTLMRRGLSGVSLLRWSPTGDYLVSAKVGGEFYLWETNTWRSEKWSSGSGRVVSCEWSADGKTVLLAFANSTAIGSIHFTGRPPSLDAHLLPVELPELSALVGVGKEGSPGCIRGPHPDSKPLTLSFHSRLQRRALLAVGWSDGCCCIYPLLFRGT
ncbi:hypothetical protein CBR_g54315 [Chara braunii]|uniref:Anaphase-promoting complex subunit 4 WD40 domain-containing protein n=1 Tax=Chara braunii TaxID=69332 RepID=A0A388MBX2_CHABU|nr:hypothetical protein CBR_g54315 [Chara braunii]|eukprot:GBG92060.1 hypothetical protein CBR_g54315 [Chara braunii]